jgi:cell division protein FtsB
MSKENETEANIQNEIEELKIKISNQEKRVNNTELNYKYLLDYDKKIFESELKLRKNDFDKDFINTDGEFTGLAIFGFTIKRPFKQDEKKPYLIVERLGTSYMIYVSNSTSGNLTRIKNFFSNFNKQLSKEKESLEKMRARKVDLENHISTSNYSHLIKQCQNELKKINQQIGLTEELQQDEY